MGRRGRREPGDELDGLPEDEIPGPTSHEHPGFPGHVAPDHEPAEDRAEKIRRALEERGTEARITLKVWRRPTDGRPRSYLSSLGDLSLDDIADLEGTIMRAFGGGDFDCEVRVGGQVRHHERISIEAPPKSRSEAPALPQVNVTQHAPVAPDPALAAAMAKIEALEKERAAEREAAKVRDEAARAAKIDKLEGAIATLAAKLDRPPPAPAAPPGPDPLLTRALDQAEAAQRELAGALKRAEKAESDARATVMEKQLAALTEAIKAKPKKSKDPFAKFADRLGSLAFVKTTLREMREDDDEGWLAEFQKPLKKMMRMALGGALEGKRAQREREAHPVGPFPEVLQEVLVSPNVVTDRAWVRRVTAAYPALMIEMTQLPSPEGVQAFVAKHLSPEIAAKVGEATPEEKARLMEIVAALRDTFLLNASAPPRVKVKKVIKRVRVREPEPEEDELDDQDEDEGEGEGAEDEGGDE